jgi:hypothetical protein
MKRGVLVGLSVLGLGVAGGAAYLMLKKKPSSAPVSSSQYGATDETKPTITVDIATGYNPVAYQTKAVDLAHLETGGWRYSGGLI